VHFYGAKAIVLKTTIPIDKIPHQTISRVLSSFSTFRSKMEAIIPLDVQLLGSFISDLTRRSNEQCYSPVLFDLASDRVFRASFITEQAVSSYLAFSPLLKITSSRVAILSGIFSVALSVAWALYPSPRPLAGIVHCEARTFLPPEVNFVPAIARLMWCPDYRLRGFVCLESIST
jgi:hypothetical protein